MELDVLDDEIMVVVVGESENEDEAEYLDETDGTLTNRELIIIKEEVVDEGDETVENLNEEGGRIYGEYEPFDSDGDEDYVPKDEPPELIINKEEVVVEGDETVEYLNEEGGRIYGEYEPFDSDGDEDYVPKDEPSDEDIVEDSRRKRRGKLLQSWQWKSFVKELRDQYEELQGDQTLLVNSLAEIMKSVKAPPPPQDHYTMNDIMFECVVCHCLTETIPAAGRHWQEKHGPRYLICFACGVDFRCTTNLYKHEKRCAAPDAEVVLRARALQVGNKGRARPFLKLRELKPRGISHSCKLCPATFNNKHALIAHMHLHNGVRPYKCTDCPCAYTSKAALSRHMKKHSDVTYVCEHCNRPFKIKAALVSHLDTHLPYKKHGCPECGRCFAQKSALVLHINGIHRNLPPPCACQLCPKRYKRMNLLKNHMMKEHGLQLMTKKMFFKKLPTMTDTQIQQAKVVFKADEPQISVIKQEIDPNEEFLSYIEEIMPMPGDH